VSCKGRWIWNGRVGLITICPIYRLIGPRPLGRDQEVLVCELYRMPACLPMFRIDRGRPYVSRALTLRPSPRTVMGSSVPITIENPSIPRPTLPMPSIDPRVRRASQVPSKTSDPTHSSARAAAPDTIRAIRSHPLTHPLFDAVDRSADPAEYQAKHPIPPTLQPGRPLRLQFMQSDPTHS
jgi:hypothetical protein